jgi:hypothetical protein
MSIIVLPDPPVAGEVTDDFRKAQNWWVRWFQQVKNQFPLMIVDTSAGSQSIALPSGAVYINQERTYVKALSDVNTVTITGALGGSVVLSTQYAKARFRYDGKNWWPV